MSAAAHVQPCVGGGLFPPRSASLSAYARIVAPHYWDAGRSPGGGPVQAHFPVSTAPRQITGSLRRGYVDEYYGWIHIKPSRLDVGMVATEQYFDVYAWNAVFRGTTLWSFNGVPDGMEFIGNMPPMWLNPLEEKMWQLHVTPTGAPDIDADIVFQFDSESPSLRVTATRILGWGWPPDWSDGIEERLIWETDVLSSQVLVEQRRALRAAPRREFVASFISQGRNRQALDSGLFAWAGRAWAVPVWPDIQRLASSVSAGEQFVACETLGFDFVASGLAILALDPIRYEVAQITEVTADGLHIKRPLQQDWPVGAKLLPVRRAVLAEMPELTRQTDQVQEFTARFVVVDNCLWPELPDMPQYRGYPVLAAKPDESKLLTASQHRLREIFSPVGAPPLYIDVAGLGMPVVLWAWLDMGRDRKAWLKSLLYTLRGQQKTLWVPTHADDMTVVAVAGEVLTIANIFFSRLGGPRCGRRDLRIDMRDGQVLYRRILSCVEVDPETERIVLDAALGSTVAPGDIARVSWLTLSRLASDEVSIYHITDEIARASLTFQGVRDDDLS